MAQSHRFIQIFGLHRSGTNFLKYLFEKNLNQVLVIQEVLAWKHGPLPINLGSTTSLSRVHPDLPTQATEGNVRTAVIAKPLKPWLASIKRIREAVIGAEIGWTEDRVTGWTARWVSLNSHWLEAKPEWSKYKIFTWFEDLFLNTESELERVCNELHLHLNVTNRTLANGFAMLPSSEGMHGDSIPGKDPIERESLLLALTEPDIPPEMWRLAVRECERLQVDQSNLRLLPRI